MSLVHVESMENDAGSPWPKIEPASFGTTTGVNPDRDADQRRDPVGRDAADGTRTGEVTRE
jgi:hypothetical protein